MAYNEKHLVKLADLKALGTKQKEVADALAARVDTLENVGSQANVLEGVKVNGTALAIANKMVDILIASGEENGTISVNGAAVAIKGLAALAYKSEITEDELGEALKASIAAKATKADLDALTVRVGDIEKAGYQTAEQVQAAIAASGHAHFEVAETDPTAEGFEAQANVMYLYMNSKTKHYDIYAKVENEVVLLDDTTVDLTNYVEKEEGKGLSTNDYTTEEKEKLAGIEEGANKYTHPAYDAQASGFYKVTVDATGRVSAVVAVTKDDIVGLGIPAQDTTYSPATAQADGLMSKDDKAKLDGMDVATEEEVAEMLNEVFAVEQA